MIANETKQSLVVVWECHRTCDESCLHERPEGKSVSREREFSSWEGHSLIRDIANLQPDRFVIGGDIFGRRDILQLTDLAHRVGISPWISLPASRDLTPAMTDALASHGAAGLIFALESTDSHLHDLASGIEGSFELTADAIVNARIKGTKVEIVTNLWKHNFEQLEAIAELAADLDVQRWTIFLPVPVGFQKFDMPSPSDVEDLLNRLEKLESESGLAIEIEEGQIYRRHKLQHWIAKKKSWMSRHFSPEQVEGDSHVAPVRGRPHETLFISHVGEIYLGSRMPLTGGNVHFESLAELHESSPIFRMLRDRSLLVGKCRSCEFKGVCGGSRARAFAMTGDPMEGDPLCIYQPGRLSNEWLAPYLPD